MFGTNAKKIWTLIEPTEYASHINATRIWQSRDKK